MQWLHSDGKCCFPLKLYINRPYIRQNSDIIAGHHNGIPDSRNFKTPGIALCLVMGQGSNPNQSLEGQKTRMKCKEIKNIGRQCKAMASHRLACVAPLWLSPSPFPLPPFTHRFLQVDFRGVARMNFQVAKMAGGGTSEGQVRQHYLSRSDIHIHIFC